MGAPASPLPPVPDFATTCPIGTRVVLLYEVAREDGTWGEITPPRYGVTAGRPRQSWGPGPTIEIKWDGEALPVTLSLSLSVWWGSPASVGVCRGTPSESTNLNGVSATGFGRAEDLESVRKHVRAHILDRVRADAKEAAAVAERQDLALRNLTRTPDDLASFRDLKALAKMPDIPAMPDMASMRRSMDDALEAWVMRLLVEMVPAEERIPSLCQLVVSPPHHGGRSYVLLHRGRRLGGAHEQTKCEYTQPTASENAQARIVSTFRVET